MLKIYLITKDLVALCITSRHLNTEITVMNLQYMYHIWYLLHSCDTFTHNKYSNRLSDMYPYMPLVTLLELITGLDYWTGLLDWHIFGFYTF